MERTLFQTLRASDKPVLPTVLRGPTVPQVVERCSPSPEVVKYFDALPADFFQLVPAGATGESATTHAEENSASPTPSASSMDIGVDSTSPPAGVGIVLCGDPSPAAGTHNVVLGLRQWLRSRGTKIYGFLNGPRGLMRGKEEDYIDLLADEGAYVDDFLNQGGADMLGYSKFKSLSDRDATKIRATCERLQIDGLCFVGGPHELSQVANLAQRVSTTGQRIQVLGVLQSPNCNVHLEKYIPITLGFDSARGVLAEMAGNLCLETLGGSEYHFLSCGSEAVTLEVALQIAPNVCLINAEVRRSQKTLSAIIESIADTVIKRREKGKRAAVVLISEGLLENLHHMDLLKNDVAVIRKEHAASLLTDADAVGFLVGESQKLFTQLPQAARHALVFCSDPSGRPMLPSIASERELGYLVRAELVRRGETAAFKLCFHNLGQEGRCPVPTRLDAALGWSLGHVVGHLLLANMHGYVATVGDLIKPVEEWTGMAVPFLALLKTMPEGPPAIPRRHLTVDSTIFKVYQALSPSWPLLSCYRQPGPMQHFSPPSVDDVPCTLAAEYWDFAAVLEHAHRVDEVPEYDIVLPEDPPIHCTRRRLGRMSSLQRLRLKYEPQLPKCLQGDFYIRDAEISGHMCEDVALLKLAFPHSVSSSSSVSAHLRSVEIQQFDEGGETMIITQGDDGLRARSPQSDCAKKIALEKCGYAKTKQIPTPSKHQNLLGNLHHALDRRLRTIEDDTTNLQPLIIGVVYLGRDSPGAHNIVWGLHNYLSSMKTPGRLYGILMGGIGILNLHCIEITVESLEAYKNQGGLDLLGRSEKTISRSSEELRQCAASARKLKLDGLVVVGGVGTHADTALVSEYFQENEVPCRVIGVPCSIESDIPFVEQSLGYDTACKVYASIVGNLATDAATSGSTWYFIRIAGRSVSHIAAECALQTNPNIVLVSEEIQSRRLSLSDVTNMICDNVETRAKNGKNFGVVLIPEGFLSFVPEVRILISEVNQLRDANIDVRTAVELLSYLTPISHGVFQHFPEKIQQQICGILNQPQSTVGHVAVQSLESESLMKALVESELNRRKVLGTFRSGSFVCRTHSLAHQGRSALPTNFDCNLGYAMGYAAGALIDGGKTGFLVTMSNLKDSVFEWQVSGVPLTSLLSFSEHPFEADKLRLFIVPGTLLLEGRRFAHRLPPPSERIFRNPGPVQFFGPPQHLICKRLEMTNDRSARLKEIWKLCKELKRLSSANCGSLTLEALTTSLRSSLDLLRAVAPDPGF
eukprot:GEMP01001767.1.p1 GENE.GEMP01001767.1~~GEMP01001767.1.p1  ORF type:complete len:1263 (+),score=241.68 GEMP01001767.1:74-3862(+)